MCIVHICCAVYICTKRCVSLCVSFSAWAACSVKLFVIRLMQQPNCVYTEWRKKKLWRWRMDHNSANHMQYHQNQCEQRINQRTNTEWSENPDDVQLHSFLHSIFSFRFCLLLWSSSSSSSISCFWDFELTTTSMSVRPRAVPKFQDVD